MVAKSIVQIDVDDQKFKAFLDLYNEYQASLKALPGAWSKSEDVAESTADHFADMTAALMAQAELHHRIDSGERSANAAREKERKAEVVADKARVESSKKYDQNVARTNKTLKETRQNIMAIGGRIISATESVLKWVGIGSIATGLLGGGGLFGLDRLASGAGNSRRLAQGLGTTSGNEKAFALNYQRLVDPDAYLSNIENVARTPGLQYGIGGDIARLSAQGKDTADIGSELIPLIAKSFQQYGANAYGLKASGLDNIVDLQTAIRILANQKDFGQYAKGYEQNKSQLATSDQTLADWQNLDKMLSTAGDRIENILIKDLDNLAPVIGHLSDEAVDLVDKWTKKLVPAIDHFATYLDSQDFQDDIKRFTSGVKELADDTVEALRVLGVIDRPAPDPTTSSNRDIFLWNERHPDQPQVALDPSRSFSDVRTPGQANSNDSQAFRWWLPDSYSHHLPGTAPWETGSDVHNPGNLRNVGGKGFQSFASDDDGLRAMAHQLRIYEDRDHLDTITKIVSKYAPPEENDTASYIKNVVARTGFSADQHLDLGDNSVLAKLESAMTKQENGKSNFTPQALQVIINNNTGGSAVVSTSQLAR